MSLLRLTYTPPETYEDEGCEGCLRVRTIAAHMLWNALSTIKKLPLKFLLSDPGFIGTQIPVAVPCQITRKIRGRKQKGFARSKIRLAAGLPAEQVTQPPPVAFIISRKGWQHGNQCRATHGCRFDSRAALPWFKAA